MGLTFLSVMPRINPKPNFVVGDEDDFGFGIVVMIIPGSDVRERERVKH